jgi:hypothetical protein
LKAVIFETFEPRGSDFAASSIAVYRKQNRHLPEHHKTSYGAQDSDKGKTYCICPKAQRGITEQSLRGPTILQKKEASLPRASLLRAIRFCV